MTTVQRIIKYLAIAFAIFLAVSIIGGIISMFRLLGGFFGGDAATGDLKTYSVSQDIRSLAVKINAADFRIIQGEKFSVESNLKHLSVEEKNGVLKVLETMKFARTYTDSVLTLHVPAGTVLEKVDIITGAGKMRVDSLSADTIKFELGAGDVVIDSLVATSSISIDGGAGKITVSGGELHSLDLNMGVGQLNLTATLTGECDFDFGVGESNINVIGNKDDYELNIEKGLGNITLDGKSVSNIKERGNEKNSIEVRGGIGAIHLKFKESDVK